MICVGIDVAKDTHWACALDEGGRILLNRAVRNTQADLDAVLDRVTETMIARFVHEMATEALLVRDRLIAIDKELEAIIDAHPKCPSGNI